MQKTNELFSLANTIAKGIVGTVGEVVLAIAIALVLFSVETLKFVVLLVAFVLCIVVIPLILLLDLVNMGVSKFLAKKPTSK